MLLSILLSACFCLAGNQMSTVNACAGVGDPATSGGGGGDSGTNGGSSSSSSTTTTTTTTPAACTYTITQGGVPAGYDCTSNTAPTTCTLASGQSTPAINSFTDICGSDTAASINLLSSGGANLLLTNVVGSQDSSLQLTCSNGVLQYQYIVNVPTIGFQTSQNLVDSVGSINCV